MNLSLLRKGGSRGEKYRNTHARRKASLGTGLRQCSKVSPDMNAKVADKDSALLKDCDLPIGSLDGNRLLNLNDRGPFPLERESSETKRKEAPLSAIYRLRPRLEKESANLLGRESCVALSLRYFKMSDDVSAKLKGR